MHRNPTYILAFLFAIGFLINSPVLGDEIVVNGNESKIAVGDFDCMGCNSEVRNALALLMSQRSGDVTAGELWKFFKDQGIDSVENLTLCMDVQGSSLTGFGLSQLKLKIEHPDQFGALLTDVSIGENSLVVPNYEISSFKPEARLNIALGYDFMQRFSAASQERVHLDFQSVLGDEDDSAAAPVFSVEAGSQILTRRFSFLPFLGFVLFWIAVFILLSRLTRPKNNSNENMTPASGEGAFSA